MRKLMSNRYVKCTCATCSFACRVTRKHLQTGSPICPACLKPLHVARHPGYVNPITKPADQDVAGRYLEQLRQEKESQMSEWRTKWKLEDEARRRAETLSRQKEEAESKAAWEDWKKRNPDYRPLVFIDPYEQDRRFREENDREVAKIMAERQKAADEAHAAFQAAEDARWARIGAMLEKFEAANAEKAAAEPAQAAQPQPARKHYGRLWIHKAWEKNQDALSAERKPRVQERLIKDEVGENDPADENVMEHEQ